MERRTLGRTGLNVSVLGFGCGAVGGLMVRGDPADQERAVARALQAGVNYFDTAVLYGEGASERNLGRVLKSLSPPDAIVGTKVMLPSEPAGGVGGSIRHSLEGSLGRLGLERVDIFYVHNAITLAGGGGSLSARTVLQEVVPALQRLRDQGKIGFLGFTAIGDTGALHEVIDAGIFDVAQVTYNMLNSSAGERLPPGYPAQDYNRLFNHTQAAGIGVVGIRVLAGGALSGSAQRHRIASPPPAPIGSAETYEEDLKRAQELRPLVDEGFAISLTEAAIRFAMSNAAIATILVGMATVDEFDGALAAVRKGPLPEAALARVAELQHRFASESR
jgi:aryl-alcohol dehydrogenase-like predicted oxidoreductase